MLTHMLNPQLLTNHQTSNTAMDLERKYKPELKIEPTIDHDVGVEKKNGKFSIHHQDFCSVMSMNPSSSSPHDIDYDMS